MKSFWLSLFVLTAGSSASAQAVYDTLFINKGTMIAVDGNSYAYYAYNSNATFSQTNKRILLNEGDSLYLTVINTDGIEHGFDITNTVGYSAVIPANDTVTIPTKFDDLGVYLFYDDLDYPKFRYMGLGSMIAVDDFSEASFYWNIKENQAKWNDSLDADWTVDWTDYYPDYFTVNGLSNPDINSDPSARVEGAVGETIRIYIANTGQSIHSMHFHGYHLEIIYSSKNSNHVGRSKDTFPIHSMESMILELVPDKVGEYPVHDHNLVVASAGGLYPNGMFLTLLIE